MNLDDNKIIDPQMVQVNTNYYEQKVNKSFVVHRQYIHMLCFVFFSKE